MDKAEAKQKFRKADELFRAGWFEDALALLDELHEAFPEEKHVTYPRARCLAELGRHDEALELCDFMVGKWSYERAARLKRRILARQTVEFVQQETQTRSHDPDSDTPIPPILAEDDDFPVEVSDAPGGPPAPGRSKGESEPSQPLPPGVLDPNAVPPTPHPSKRSSPPGARQPRAQAPRRPLVVAIAGVVLAGLVAAGIYPVLFASPSATEPPAAASTVTLSGPTWSDRTGEVLDNMGPFGYIASSLVLWTVNAGILYIVLRSLNALSYDEPFDNALDVAIIGLVMTLLIVIPIVGLIAELVLIKQRYELSWAQTALLVACQISAALIVLALIWANFVPTADPAPAAS